MRGTDQVPGQPGKSRTTRRRFLGTAAGAAAVPAVVIGVTEAAGASPAQAQSASDPGWYDVTDYGAQGDGVADDTAAIQSAIAAAQKNAYGGVVYLPVGQYVVSSPLVVTSSDILVLGTGALATMGGAGSNDGKSTTIKPAAGWAQGSATQPACILFDAVTGGALNRCGVERLAIDGANLPPQTQMHGIATYGAAGAFSVTGCIVTSIANTSSAGITNTVTYPTTAQGNSIIRNLVQSVGGDGYDLASGDLTVEHCHAQGCGGNGFSITTKAGDTRMTDCRGDESGLNGYYIYVPAGADLGPVQLANCTTQASTNNGIMIQNASPGEICPVYLTGCVFQGDGQAGSGAGIRLSGPVAATISGCGVHVNKTSQYPAGVPLQAITTASDNVSPPVMLSMLGGFYNAVTQFCDQIDAPLRSDVRVYTYIGGQWDYNDTPALTESLSSVTLAVSNPSPLLLPGQPVPVTITTTSANTSGNPVRVQWEAQPPSGSGVSVTPASGTANLAPGASVSTRVQVTGTTPGSVLVPIAVTTITGQNTSSTVGAYLQTTTAYASLADAFDNVGITDDSDNAPGNFDGSGDSYSAQALAAAGITPGGTVTSDGVTFTWPDVAAGTDDNVITDSQTVLVPGSGSTLGLLGTGVNGAFGGTGTIYYTDRTTQSYMVTFVNWTSGSPPDGSTVAGKTSYLNTQSGQLTRTRYLYAATVPLQPRKTVQAVQLPPAGGSGQTGIHIFAVAIS